MMRTAAARRPQVAKLTLSAGAQQTRQKTFIKREDKNGEIYYFVNKWGRAKPKRPPNRELFQINNLLLDLDDMDSKHVRTCTEDDEAQMLKQWSVDPKRQALRSRLEELVSEVDWSRRKVFEMSMEPTSSWRLGSHDILSAALKGAPSSSSPGPPVDSQQGFANVLRTETPGQRQQSHTLHTICSKNGIPEHAKQDDELLLHWFQLRNQLAQSEQQTSKPPSPSQFASALREQDTVIGIRRLVSQCLSSGLDATSFHQTLHNGQGRPPSSLSSEVRDVCANILSGSQEKSATCHDLLAFLGNLSQRLSSSGAHIGEPLCGLGLRLSAEMGKPAATMEYLDMAFRDGYFGNEALGDVLDTLKTYSHPLSVDSKSRFLDISDRQTLLGLLTGIRHDTHAAESHTAHGSIRSIAIHFLRERRDDGATRMALEIYRAYIFLLGRLGAVASLWQEWRLSGAELEGLIQTGKLLMPEGQTEEIVVEAFRNAIGASLSVVALRDDAAETDLDLAGCATRDLEAIEEQNQDAWLGYQQQEAHPMRGLLDGDIRAALGLSLDGWMERLRRLAEGTDPRG
ncbi:hypothetical protein CDV31_009469 [Fusarium ambrosium]|uniref:Uncharacterized protein n=1 Tax=Fusarium ambrosium TaxID=131363 RepID=A0A428TUI9_9HYPO|nr:hypothetical protein CDV31_009469 [Fusarium ambrosium]